MSIEYKFQVMTRKERIFSYLHPIFSMYVINMYIVYVYKGEARGFCPQPKKGGWGKFCNDEDVCN